MGTTELSLLLVKWSDFQNDLGLRQQTLKIIYDSHCLHPFLHKMLIFYTVDSSHMQT